MSMKFFKLFRIFLESRMPHRISIFQVRFYKCCKQSFNYLSVSVYETAFNKSHYLVTFSHSMSGMTCKLQFDVNPDAQVFFL